MNKMKTMKALEYRLHKTERKQAYLYLFCNFVALMLISAYSAMMFSPTVLNTFPEGGDSRKQMYMVFALAIFGCTVFTIYASSLFFRKKSRQLGILMALGASKKQLAPGLFREVFTLSFSSSLLGLLAGFPFLWLIWNGFRTFVVDSAEMVLRLDPKCLFLSFAFLFLVITFSCLTAWRYLQKTNIMDVMNEEHKNEPVKELGKWCGPAGLVLLFGGAICGYYSSSIYMRLFHAYPPAWINLAYAPCFFGIYMVMLHTVIHGWGRKKRHPYKNIIARSMMKFQGRQTVNNLLVITVLIAGGSFAMFYLPIMSTGILLETSNRSHDYYFSYRADQAVPGRTQVEKTASQYQITLKDWEEHTYISLALDGYGQVEEGRKFHDEYFPLLKEGKFISETTYNQIADDTINVSPGTYYGIASDNEGNDWVLIQNASVLTNMCSWQKCPVKFAGFLHCNILADMFGYYVLDDQDYAALEKGLTNQWKGAMYLFNVDGNDDYRFATALFHRFVRTFTSDCEKIVYYDRVEKYTAEQSGDTYWGDTDAMDKISFNKPDSTNFRSYWLYMPKIRILDQNDYLQTFAVFLMMFLFIFIICYLAALIICYTRCQTIALNNRYVFDDLKKLGASPKFLIREVKNQCGKIFALPTFTGMSIMFLFCSLIMFANDNKIEGAEIVGLAICLCILLLIALLIYGIYHKTLQTICRQLDIQEYEKIEL